MAVTSEIISLGLENYSHLQQRCELINVTQVPTNSGNAQVQLATFPKVEQKLNNKLELIDESKWLVQGERFLDVQRAFNWIVYLVELDRNRSQSSTDPINFQVRARNLISNNVLTFKSYQKPISTVEPFQVLEFVDLNSNRWVVINTFSSDFKRNKTVRFMDSSTFSPVDYDFSEDNDLTVLPGTFNANGSDAESNKFYEVFIEGTYFEDYKFIRDFSMNGFFNTDYDKQEDQTWIWRLTSEGNFQLSDISVNELNALENSIEESEDNPCVTVFSKELKETFETSLLHDQINDYETDGIDGDRPAVMKWYDGFQMLSWLLTSISDEENRKRRDYVNDATVAVLVTSIGAAIMTAGGYLFATTNPVGWIAGGIALIVGGITWVLGSYFEEDYIDSFRLSGDEVKVNNLGFFEICDVIKKALGMGTMTDGVNRAENNRPLLMSDTAFSTLEIDTVLPINNDYTGLGAQIATVHEALNWLVEWREKNSNLYLIYAYYLKDSAGTSFSNAARANLNGFLNAFINGGSCNVPRKVIGAGGSDSSKVDGWQSIRFVGMKTLRDKIGSVLLQSLNGDKSGEVKELFDTINNNIKHNIVPQRKENGQTVSLGETGLIYVRDRLTSLSEEIIGDDRFSESERGNINSLIARAKNSINSINRSCLTMIEWLEKQLEIKYYSIFIFDQARTNLSFLLGSSFTEQLNNLATELTAIKDFLVNFRDDYHIFDIESFSHMLIAITTDDRFYYSDAGTTSIQGLNFYSAEYANSSPVEAWRLANRLVLFTNNTVEFWDITNDFDDPLSPAYSSNVYSLTVLQNSRVKFNDTLYFIAKPVELDSYSVYSLTKNGQLQKISYPQLDVWINKQIITDFVSYNPLAVNLNYNVRSSVINYENVPMIQWHLSDRALNLNYNVTFNTFFLSDELYFLENQCYFQLNSNIAGTLTNYFNQDKTAIEAILKTVNTNFDPKKRYKTVAMFHGDVDLQDHRNFVDASVTRPNNQVIKTEKSYWNKFFASLGDINVEDYQTIRHKFYRVSNQPWETLRIILLKPKQGERNVVYKIVGIGMGIDFQTEMRWNGFLRINNLAYEVE